VSISIYKLLVVDLHQDEARERGREGGREGGKEVNINIA